MHTVYSPGLGVLCVIRGVSRGITTRDRVLYNTTLWGIYPLGRDQPPYIHIHTAVDVRHRFP